VGKLLYVVVNGDVPAMTVSAVCIITLPNKQVQQFSFSLKADGQNADF
jgi:hypothetical protein